ncbi:formate dehydrogenase accessory sulfurtransferase FdhD [Marinobacter zhejiangensis]|uniref:Sulfur carrier protein FdhD n=1 Tax=Marinobacter zhejiangensis TaxID=488535 RepID=A0A1I4PFI3_9GAMM|nr:formate dehydrogenase accessory sulfurtransferase FdhD [Marinobacter zhejiangensis]SFM26335.1 FdhD protein [Marinobacter zhejiangensis]
MTLCGDLPAPASDAGALSARPDTFEYAGIDDALNLSESRLAGEVALAINYNGINHAVMMVSPLDYEDFIIGFSLASGIIQHPGEIYRINLADMGNSVQADIEVSNRAVWVLKQSRRSMLGSSGCGICGVEALDQAIPQLEQRPHAKLPAPATLHALRQRISSHQVLAQRSGALHGAFYIDSLGAVVMGREDIGRHNALDKLIGAMAIADRNAQEGFVVVTSRCSLELIVKAVRANVGTLVSLSAPTALATNTARDHGLNLIHLPHHSPARVYSPAPESR